MYKIEQLLKPLTDTVPESDNSTRGHGLAAETPTIRTLTTALLYCARTCTFLAGPTRVRPSPYPTPRGLDALPRPDSTGQTRKLPSLPQTGRGFRAPSSSHNQAPGDSEPWPWVIWEGTSSPKAQVGARMALQGGIEILCRVSLQLCCRQSIYLFFLLPDSSSSATGTCWHPG